MSARGEISLVLAGASFMLRPSFGALMALEAELGMGLLSLAKRFANGDFSLGELAAVISAGIKGAGGEVPSDLGDRIAREGVARLAMPIGAFLAAALTGEDPLKEASGPKE